MKRRSVLTQILGRLWLESKGCPKRGKRWSKLGGPRPSALLPKEGWSRARDIDEGNDGAIVDSLQST